MSKLLEGDDLSVGFRTPRGVVQALTNASIALDPGEHLLVVGESGSGKTVLAHSLLRLLPKNASVSGAVRLGGEDLLGPLRSGCETCEAVASPSSPRVLGLR